jgi:ABC-2 type transport system permease protein
MNQSNIQPNIHIQFNMIVSNILAIYRRELQSYFASPFAYIIAGVYWLLSGFFFIYILLSRPDGLIFAANFRDQMGISDPPVDVAFEFIKAFLGVLGNLVLFLSPILSMGLYAEERKRGTLELLATSPISNWSVAVGKLLGIVTFFVGMVLPMLVYEAIAISAANPPMPPTIMLLAHGGLILLAAAVLSMGMFISSLTDSTILAAILTFALALFLWVIDLFAVSITGPVGEALNYISLIRNFKTLTEGIFAPSSLIVFGSYIFLGVFLTAQSIESFRYQRS